MTKQELLKLLPDGNEGKPELNYKLRTLFEFLLKKVEMIELMAQGDQEGAELKGLEDGEVEAEAEAETKPSGRQVPEEKQGGKTWGKTGLWKK